METAQVKIEKETHKKLKLLAVRLDKSIEEIATEIIEKALKNYSEKQTV